MAMYKSRDDIAYLDVHPVQCVLAHLPSCLFITWDMGSLNVPILLCLLLIMPLYLVPSKHFLQKSRWNLYTMPNMSFLIRWKNIVESDLAMIVVLQALKPRLARGCLEHISQSCVFRISVLRPVTERAMKGEVVHLSCFACAINLAEEKRWTLCCSFRRMWCKKK
jgi:hypothetical protein